MDWGKIIYPGLAALFTAFLFWAWGAVRDVPTILTPSGAVVAFELSKCPDGWKEFSSAHGRAIVGVGHGKGLSNRTLLEEGGAESHTLTIPELPPHSHTGNVGNSGWSFEHHKSGRMPMQNWSKETGKTGKGNGHNNMQPFLALRYCQKL